MRNASFILLCLILTGSEVVAAPRANARPAVAPAPVATPPSPAPAPAEDKKASDKLPVFSIEANAGFGYQFFGGQQDLAKSALTPTPDYYVNFFYGGRMTILPASFGFTADFDRHLFRAASLSGGGGYSVYTYDRVSGGLAYAHQLKNSGENRSMLMFGAGVSYTMLQLADQFKSDLQKSANSQNVSLSFSSEAAKGVGGYLQGGFVYFLNANIFLSASVRISYTNAKFSGATKNLDSWGFEIPFGFGVGF